MKGKGRTGRRLVGCPGAASHFCQRGHDMRCGACKRAVRGGARNPKRGNRGQPLSRRELRGGRRGCAHSIAGRCSASEAGQLTGRAHRLCAIRLQAAERNSMLARDAPRRQHELQDLSVGDWRLGCRRGWREQARRRRRCSRRLGRGRSRGGSVSGAAGAKMPHAPNI